MYQVTEKSTVFGFKTPFGKATPFKYPSASTPGGSLANIFAELSSQLYPTGRAWYMLENSIFRKFHNAVNVSFFRLTQDAKSTIDSVFPDNENFSEEDCNLWEYRFGMVTNSSLSVEVRRKALLRRMSRGRNIPARQHVKYIEYQLQLAGFDVYVYENGFVENGILVYKRPQEILDSVSDSTQHGGDTQHGIGTQHGGSSSDVIANSYHPNEIYSVGDEYLSKTFFLGGSTLGSIATIQGGREKEFRELVLKLKPAHLAVFTLIQYL